jgi:biopolymer transport protein TolR
MSWRRRAGNAKRGDLPPNAEINITSLIDVAFTLLVIFIITAPVLQGGVEVRLPRAQVQPVTAQDSPFIVSVVEDGTVMVGETPVSPAEFNETFPQLLQVASPGAVYIRGDSLAIYGRMLPVIATVFQVAQTEGVPVRLVGEPEPRRR